MDVNTFYGEKAGGIRTYHNAKIEWFKKHQEHTYYIIGPGPYFEDVLLAPNVHYIRLEGKAVTSDPKGYRVLFNVVALAKLIRKIKPDILESGEPWVSGPMALFLKKCRVFKGVNSSFYHSDPIRTYLLPWAGSSFFRRVLVSMFSFFFFQMQKRYDITVTASRVMQNYLQKSKVERVLYNPFGAPLDFFANYSQKSRMDNEPLKLLYSGRLDSDKGISFLQEVMPSLLKRKNIELTVMGRGKEESFFQSYTHPRFVFKGFVSDKDAYLIELQKAHFFLAMGPWETFGLGALEAMASGLGILGVTEGGIGEMLEGVPNSFSFEYKNKESFEEALEQALESNLSDIAVLHHKNAQEYGTWDESLSNLETIYKRAAS